MPGLRAIISDDRFGSIKEEKAVLEPLGVQLEVRDCHSEEDVLVLCGEADALLVNLAPISARVLAGLNNCKVVARYGVGLDNVDVLAANQHGIKVFNVPDYCSEDVAQHSLALLLAMLRDLPARNRAVHKGGWNLPASQYSVCGKTIGVLGFGHSGRAFCRVILALKPQRLLVYSPNNSQQRLDHELKALADLMHVELVVSTLPELLKQSDIISIHLRLSEETKNMFDERTFRLLKPGVFIINTARGAIIDAAALRAALDQEIVAGAALDVHFPEPPHHEHPLLGHPRVIMSDHCAYRSTTSISLLKTRTAENAARGLGLIP